MEVRECMDESVNHFVVFENGEVEIKVAFKLFVI